MQRSELIGARTFPRSRVTSRSSAVLRLSSLPFTVTLAFHTVTLPAFDTPFHPDAVFEGIGAG